jgi:hypothetical protein
LSLVMLGQIEARRMVGSNSDPGCLVAAIGWGCVVI